MKKRIVFFIIFIAAAILFSFCSPVTYIAEDGTGIEERFRNPDADFEETAYRLFETGEAVGILRNMEESVKEHFFQSISGGELYKFTLLYRYGILDEAAKAHRRGEKTGDAHGEESTVTLREIVDKDLALYRNLLDLLKKYKEEPEIGENQGEEGGQKAEAAQKTESAQIAESEQKAQQTEKAEELQGAAFLIFQSAVLKNIADLGTQEFTDFEGYAAFLQNRTGLDIIGAADQLERLEAAVGEEAEQIFRELTEFLYKIYGTDIGQTDAGINGKDQASEENESNLAKRNAETGNLSPEAGMDGQVMAMAPGLGIGVTYRAYCQTYAWKGWSNNGEVSGAAGEKKRMEALQVKITGDSNLGISYQAHVQGRGWMSWANDGITAGTTGQSLRLEAFRMKLTGISSGNYDIYYRAWCESYGWLDWAKNGQSSGTVNISKRMEAFQVVITAKGGSAPGAASVPLQTNAVARVDNSYYKSLNSAFDALPAGGTLNIIRDCNAAHIITEKSFTICPEERSVRITSKEESMGPAGMFATPDGKGNPTWTISGKDGYTITFDANGKASSGVLSSHEGTIHLKSGARLTNSPGNGIWNDSGTTNIYEGASIYNNGSGIATLGTINIYGGKIYGNKNDGVRSQKEINMYGGEIYNNQECGVHVGEGSCTFTMSGGSIHDNLYGVANYNAQGIIHISAGNIYNNWKDGIHTKGRRITITGSVTIQNNGSSGIVIGGGSAEVKGGKICGNRVSGIVNQSTLKISGGEIYSNSAPGNGGGILNNGILTMSGGTVAGNFAGAGGGICISPGSTLHLSGGIIKGNSAKKGNGVYHNGNAMNVNGNGAVAESNDVYLCAGKFVSITGTLYSGTAALLTPDSYVNGRKAAEAVYGSNKASQCFKKLKLAPHGAYCLRPGDYQVSQAGSKGSDIVLSTQYAVRYIKNYDGEVRNMPDHASKYWYENFRLSVLQPLANLIKFRGWSESAQADKANYLPAGSLSASINRDVNLYAVWGTKIKVNYTYNRSGTEIVKSEYLTLKECIANQGYDIRKNAGFTNFTAEKATFTGWDITTAPGAKEVMFPENKACKISFEELLDLASKQQGNTYSDEELIQELTFYASWDEAPVITAESVLEFYEGMDVTKEMLLENVRAYDKEDGDITSKLKILAIEYADGKLSEGMKQEGITEKWKEGAPGDYLLDTWFMQLDKNDAPVTHQMVFGVIDSIGNETQHRWTVRVKYNEFPVIETEDWYFTLKEAQNGSITEECLLNAAVNEGRVKASDEEDDKLFPGEIQKKIELIHFDEEDFKTFEESGYIVVTYSVKDSMGPDGEGKETLRQSTVHIMKDGEVVHPKPVQYVRFINQGYYEKNLDEGTASEDGTASEEISSEEMSPEEQAASIEGNEKDNYKGRTQERYKAFKNGGLHVKSKWYRNPEYRGKITRLWSDDKPACEVWIFTKEDVKKAKKYVITHGIGNSQEKNALTEFAVRFGHLKKL